MTNTRHGRRANKQSTREPAQPIYTAGGNFNGHRPRACGEHRTVGPHRAWCYQCGEWCYPNDGCIRCRYPSG
jgi:hypothetical protein